MNAGEGSLKHLNDHKRSEGCGGVVHAVFRGTELSQHLTHSAPPPPGSSQPAGKGPALLPAGSGCCRKQTAVLGPCCFFFLSSTKQGQTSHWLQKPSWLQQRTFGIKLVLATKKQCPRGGGVGDGDGQTPYIHWQKAVAASLLKTVELDRYKLGSAQFRKGFKPNVSVTGKHQPPVPTQRGLDNCCCVSCSPPSFLPLLLTS